MNYAKILGHIKSNFQFFLILFNSNREILYDLLIIQFSLWLSFSLLTGGLYSLNFNLFYISFATSFIFLFSAYLVNYYKIVSHFPLRHKFPFALKLFFLNSIFFVLFILLNPRSGIPFLIAFFQPILSFALIASREWFLKKALNLRGINNHSELILIYGAGKLGLRLSDYLIGENKKIVRFFDDDENLWGKFINGVEISNPKYLSEMLWLSKISYVYIAFANPSEAKIGELLVLLKDYEGVKLKIAPSFINSKLYENQDVARDLSLADLLGRKENDPIDKLLTKKSTGKSILITGAGGSIGNSLCHQLLSLKVKKIILIDSSEFALYSLMNELKSVLENNSLRVELVPILASILDYQLLESVVAQHNPFGIYHTAAYKHVSLIEGNALSGIKNNVFGTYNIAKVCLKHSLNFCVLISSDKAVNPSNIMGLTKKISEQIMIDSQRHKKTIFSIVRFGNVLNSSGSVVPLFKKQIENGGPVTVTDISATRYFMSLTEASSLVIQSSSLAIGGDIFVLDMGEPVKIYDLAKKMILLYGNNKNIEIKVIGLTQGEKIHEELFDGFLEDTEHPKIKKCYEGSSDDLGIDEFMIKLNDCLNLMDFDKLKLLLEARFRFDFR